MSMKRNQFSQADWALDLRSEAQKRANMLKSAVREAEDYVKRAPQGMLRDIKHGKSFQYFWRKEKSDTNGTYLPASSETRTIRELAQKDYCLKFIKEAKEELRSLENYLSTTEKRNVEAVYMDMSEARKVYSNPFITPDDLYIRQWEDRTYEQGYFAPDYPEYYSAKGERVRSKAEENIANLLILNKIPYHYECPFVIGGEEKRPDFYCLKLAKMPFTVYFTGSLCFYGRKRTEWIKNAKRSVPGWDSSCWRRDAPSDSAMSGGSRIWPDPTAAVCLCCVI